MYENNYPNHFENTNTYHYTEDMQPQKPVKKPDKSMGVGRKIALGICCGLLFGIFAGVGFVAVTGASGLVIDENERVNSETLETIRETVGEPEQTKEKEIKADDVIAPTVQTEIVKATVTDVTEVVKTVMPAVVSINSKYLETTSFFGQQYSSESVGSGSGIIVGQNDTELLLVTNFHVVEAAEELTVQFCDGSQALAQIKGSDRDKDLAVIAVQMEDIESETRDEIAVATLGNSTELTIGEPVIAIGNALGYGQSVTTGVVSALNRQLGADTSYVYGTDEELAEDEEINTFIQTDAAINPGNSGGALLNIKGEVIGINSSKIGGSAIEGMGYAIPISDAEPIIEDLMTKQTKLRVDEDEQGYLGITGVDVVAEYSKVYDMPRGVYVSSVTEGTGADKAGLVRGDIITAINGEVVESMDELKDELSYYSAGMSVELTIMQGSPIGYQAKNVSVTLGNRDFIEKTE